MTERPKGKKMSHLTLVERYIFGLFGFCFLNAGALVIWLGAEFIRWAVAGVKS